MVVDISVVDSELSSFCLKRPKEDIEKNEVSIERAALKIGVLEGSTLMTSRFSFLLRFGAFVLLPGRFLLFLVE